MPAAARLEGVAELRSPLRPNFAAVSRTLGGHRGDLAP